MKRNLFLASLCIVAGTLSICQLSAQNGKKRFPFKQGSEIRLSIGIYPLDATRDLYSMGYIHFDEIYRYPLVLNTPGNSYYSFQNYFQNQDVHKGPTRITGAISLGYTYRFSRKFELAGYLAYSGGFVNYYDNYNDQLSYKKKVHSISVTPIVRWVWFQRKLVRLYSSAGIGVSIDIATEKDNNESLVMTRILPSGQLNYFGMTVGNKLYGVLELSAGTLGFVTVGMGYKF